MRFLIVDDSRMMRKLVIRAISNIRNTSADEHLEFDDGADAAMEIDKEEAINAFFVDLNIPNVNGLDLVERIRSKSTYSETPVVVITSEAGEETIAQAKKRGANLYLKKPMRLETIGESIAPLIKA